ncbi:ATPase [Burkholderia ubonensis]|uniref:ATPase n=1 Tax=Burkholderia ubonensis TaxID=101571 RepID=A0ABD4E790_9BURK|nr:DNA-binding protein [Burkholderia ubonensis]KVH78791.1 ATPase [Burkholderia ubonensis]KVN88823.1 ATPase [Burkholderia ubonensis]KVU04984.1 ATPase [Burkholderia ubonensis]
MTDALSPSAAPDAALAVEIERLKAAHPNSRDTRALYREVCALLFFRFGLTPTANRLYQLVRRGSMGTPTEVLAEFWAALREKSRVRVERPDLPPDVQAAAGELVATLWEKSNAAAYAALEALRGELEVEREAGRLETARAQEATVRAEATLADREAALLAAHARTGELEQALAVSEAACRTLETDVARLQRENRERDAALAQARADFTLGLEKLREAAQRSEERLQAAEKRALLEIDRERATATRLQKELDAALRRAEQRDERHRTEADGLRTQLGEARHQIGVLQGRLDAAESSSAASARELDTLRQQLSAMPSSSAKVSPRDRPPRRGRAAKKPTLPLRTQHRPKGPGT